MLDKEVAVKYDDDFAYISWDGISSYLLGMDECFNYRTILATNSNSIKIKKKDIDNFLSLKAICLPEKDVCDSIIEIKFLKSYSGITLSFRSKEIYDKYFLYEMVDGKYDLIAECEDFQINSDFKEDSFYYVEGYISVDGKYVLKGKSIETKCELIDVLPNNNNISIIIPIFNSERFLSRCIDSILLSSFTDFEIILVDDGSYDNSPMIVDWYLDNYKSFIKVIHKKNEGLSFARNSGIELVHGIYTAFVDSDDIVHPYMYENLYNTACENKLDVVISKTIRRRMPYEYDIVLDINCDGYLIYDYDKLVTEKVNNSFDNIFFVAVWNKIIKSDIVKKHPFPNENHYEDTAFTITIYSYINRFGFCNDAYYIWDNRIRNTVGTLSSSYNNDNIVQLNKYFIGALSWCIKNGNPERLDYLIYDVLYEIFNYLKNSNISICSESFNLYLSEINFINEKYDIINNRFIKENKNLYDYFNFLLNFKTE